MGRAKGSAPPLLYGERVLEDYLPERVLSEGRLVPLDLPGGAPEIPDVDGSLLRALEESSTPDLAPSPRHWLDTRYRGGGVSIVLDDHTRPCVHQRRLLPCLLEWLTRRGVDRERISLLIAGATHRAPRPEEYPRVLGEEVARDWRDRTFPHRDTGDLVTLGRMADGVPVELNARAAGSEILLGLSDLDYHYFAGVTGGPKQLVPGIAGRALTTADHLRMFGPLGFAAGCDMGLLDGNPVYEYKRAAVGILLDAMRRRGSLVYGVVCVLTPRHGFVALEGGDVVALQRKLRTVLDRVYAVRLPRPADVAIVSARHLGLNVYQAGKAVNTAARAVRPGGTVLCLAPCEDGLGNDEFRDLMGPAARVLKEGEPGAPTIERALAAVQDAAMTDFRIGKQKPVDLLAQYRHTGWGNLWLECDGLDSEERALLPFRYVPGEGGDPAGRLRTWVEERERESHPAYVAIDDPTYWIRPESAKV